jgi:hypothetical protein
MYFQVGCWHCHIAWNFYDVVHQYVPITGYQPLYYQGCVCPKCGRICCIPSGVAANANQYFGEGS